MGLKRFEKAFEHFSVTEQVKSNRGERLSRMRDRDGEPAAFGAEGKVCGSENLISKPR